MIFDRKAESTRQKSYAVATHEAGRRKIHTERVLVDADADPAWGDAVNIPLTINKKLQKLCAECKGCCTG